MRGAPRKYGSGVAEVTPRRGPSSISKHCTTSSGVLFYRTRMPTNSPNAVATSTARSTKQLKVGFSNDLESAEIDCQMPAGCVHYWQLCTKNDVPKGGVSSRLRCGLYVLKNCRNSVICNKIGYFRKW